MKNDSYITNSEVVFVYERNSKIRKRVFEFEESLNNFFKVPFRTIPVPDDLDPNIPRIEAESLSGHSSLQISPIRLTLSTRYSEDFSKNIVRIRDYVSKRVEKLKPLIRVENIQFVAYILQLRFRMNKEQINSYLKKHTGIKAITENTADLSLLYSLPLSSKYYLNVKSLKYTEEELIVDPERRIIRKSGKKIYGVSIMLDFNTKYYYQKNESFQFQFLDEIEKDIFNIIDKNKLENYLNGRLVQP